MSVPEYTNQWGWLVILTLVISTFVDFMVASSLSYYLWDKRKDVFKQRVSSVSFSRIFDDTNSDGNSTQRVVDKLIAWTIRE